VLVEFVQVEAVFKSVFQVRAVMLGCESRGVCRGVVDFLVSIL
jgi:hypothetical protein